MIDNGLVSTIETHVFHARQKFSVQVHISRVSNLQGRKQFFPLARKLIQSRDQLPRHAAKWDAIAFFPFPFFFFFAVFPLQLHAADRFRVSNDKGTRVRIETIGTVHISWRRYLWIPFEAGFVTKISKYFLSSVDFKTTISRETIRGLSYAEW